MLLTNHEMDHIARRLAEVLAEPIRAIIRQEIKPMVDAVGDLTVATDAALLVVADLLAEVQKDVAALAVMPKDNTPALEQQIARLQSGTSAAATALAALQNPAPAAAAPAAPAAPAAEAPAASADAQAATAAPAAAAPAAADPAAPAA